MPYIIHILFMKFMNIVMYVYTLNMYMYGTCVLQVQNKIPKQKSTYIMVRVLMVKRNLIKSTRKKRTVLHVLRPRW